MYLILAGQCNTEPCQLRLKACPGSSRDAYNASNPLQPPSIECSNHGTCIREKSDCREGDSCVVYCQCSPQYAGKGCAKSLVDYAALLAFRSTCLHAMIDTWAVTDPNPSAVAQQVSTFAALIATAADELSAVDRQAALEFATELAGIVSPADVTTFKLALRTIGALSAQAVIDARAATAAVSRLRRLHGALHAAHEQVNSNEAGGVENNQGGRSLVRGVSDSTATTAAVKRELSVSARQQLAAELRAVSDELVPHPHDASAVMGVSEWLTLDASARAASLRRLREDVLDAHVRRLSDSISSAVSVQNKTNVVLNEISKASLQGVTPFEAPIVLSVRCRACTSVFIRVADVLHLHPLMLCRANTWTCL